MFFHRSRIINMSSEEIDINNININRVSHTKVLDVIIDQKLSWAQHANYIQAKLSKGAAFISKVRRNLPKSVCIINLSYLIYYVKVWGNTSKYIPDPNSKKNSQNYYLFFIRAPTDELFKALDVLRFNTLVMHRIVMFMHTIYLSAYLICNKDIHNYNTRQKASLT